MAEINHSVVRARLQMKIARSFGTQFENLLEQLFRASSSNAIPIHRPIAGDDHHQDWFDVDTGRYYHVHSPETFDEVDAVGEIVQNIRTLMGSEPASQQLPTRILEFYFVANDAYRITSNNSPAIYSTLELCRRKHSLKRARPFLAIDLEDEFMKRIELAAKTADYIYG